MINPLDAWKQHAIASEEMDLTGVGTHQKKGYNFAQNFPSLVPGGGVTATQWVGPALSTGYQYAQELGRSILPEEFLGGTNISLADAWKKAGVESDANIQGMLGKDFNKDEYNEWMAEHGYGPEYDFSDIEGQTALLGLPQLFGMLKGGFSKKAAINYAKKRAALSAANLALSTGSAIAGQKNKPSAAQIQSRLDSGIQNARERRSDRNVGGGRGVQSLGTSATARGSKSAQGYSQHAHGGRAGYFDGGLLSLWPR